MCLGRFHTALHEAVAMDLLLILLHPVLPAWSEHNEKENKNGYICINFAGCVASLH